MPKNLGPEETSVVIKFGGGIRSRAPADEIEDRECVSGQNFDMDLQDTQFRPRPGFQLVGIPPLREPVRGMGSLLQSDGTVKMFVQVGATVYDWNGSNFTAIDTVDDAAKLRGHIWHNWQLDDKLLITDINLKQNVMEWDGTTFKEVTFVDEDSNPFGSFKAKYLVIDDERALFANVIDSASVEIPHMIVASKVSDYTNITVSNKPSSALGEDDPFYVLTPDLRYINGFLSAFDVIIASTMEGKIFKMIGASAKDFAIDGLYPQSGASGDESMKYVGNDVHYGRQSRIESLKSNDKFGNVEADDLSVSIFPDIEDFSDWTLTYNERTQRVYCYAQDTGEIWVLYKPLINSKVSPWSKFKTQHFMSFNPTVMMNCYDPQDGLEYVFFGDSQGYLYKMEGLAGYGDGARIGPSGLIEGNPLKTERRSKMVSLPEGTEAFNIQGWVRYRKITPIEVILTFEFQGDQVFTEVITVELEGASGGSFYGGGSYYGGGSFYGSDTNKFKREVIGVPGKSTEFQVKATIITRNEFAVSEIGLRFQAVS